MLFLWIFGNNVEDQMGRFSFLLLYLISGWSRAHINPGRPTVPLVGHRGGGRSEAYLVARGQVRTVIFLFAVWPRSALVLLAFWLISQFFISNDAGIAWVAHVAGFVFGMVAGIIARTDDGFERSLHAQYRRMARIMTTRWPGSSNLK